MHIAILLFILVLLAFCLLCAAVGVVGTLILRAAGMLD